MSFIKIVSVLVICGAVGFGVFTMVSDSGNDILPTPTVVVTPTVTPTEISTSTFTSVPTVTSRATITSTLNSNATVNPTSTQTPNTANDIYVPPYEVVENNILTTDISVKANISDCEIYSIEDYKGVLCNAKVQEIYSSIKKNISINESFVFGIGPVDIEDTEDLKTRFEGLYLLSANQGYENTFNDPGNGYRFKYSKELEEFFIQAALVSNALIGDEFLME